jgi:isoamylase
LCRGQGCGDLYVAFNVHGYAITVGLPGLPEGRKWVRVVDTNLPSPKDFTPDNRATIEGTYTVNPFSSILLQALAV